MFQKALEGAGMAQEGKNGERSGPNPYCMRHAFFHRAYRQYAKATGQSFEDIMPFLSAYGGHEDACGTEHYLRYESDIFEEDNELMDMIMDEVMPL
jgi:integrase